MQKWSLHYVAWCFALCINSSPPVQAQTFTIALHEDSLALRPCKEKVTQLYQALDMPIELIELPGRRSLKYANDGKTDAELCRIGQITKRYRNLVKISPALMSLDFIALTKSRWPAVTQLSDLDHARIGTSRGMMAAEMVLENAIIVYESNVELIMRLLVDDLVDAIILPRVEIEDALTKQSEPEQFILSPTLYSFELFHFIHKKHFKLKAKLSHQLLQLQSTSVSSSDFRPIP